MLGSPLTDTVNKSDTSRRIQQVQLCDMRSAKSEHVVFLFFSSVIFGVLACHSRCRSAEAVSKKKIKKESAQRSEASDMDAQTKQEKEPKF
ncbi:hypothetical protein Tco_1099269, partial [Tanacetum coccineum]